MGHGKRGAASIRPPKTPTSHLLAKSCCWPQQSHYFIRRQADFPLKKLRSRHTRSEESNANTGTCKPSIDFGDVDLATAACFAKTSRVLQRGMFFADVEHRLATTLIGDCNVFRINLADKDRIPSKIAPLAFCTSGFLLQSSWLL